MPAPLLSLLLRLAALLGRLAGALRLRGPSPEEVGEAFADLPPGRRGRVARDAAATRFANAVVRRATRSEAGMARIAALLEVRGGAALEALLAAGRPVVLASWHAGLLNALPAALARLAAGRRALLLAREPHPGASRVGALVVAGIRSAAQRAAALLRAVHHLRGGGVVALASDVAIFDGVLQPGGDRLLGHAVRLMPGPGALARLGRAAIVPLALRLEGGRVVAELLPAIEWEARGESHEEGERAVVARLGAAWEAYFRERPGEMWVERVRGLAAAPLVPGEAVTAVGG